MKYIKKYITENDYYILRLESGKNPVEITEDSIEYQKCLILKIPIEIIPFRPFVKSLETIFNEKWEKVSMDYEIFCNAHIHECVVGELKIPMPIAEQHTSKLQDAINLLKFLGQTHMYITDATDTTHYNISLEDASLVCAQMGKLRLEAHSYKQVIRQKLRKYFDENNRNALEGLKWDFETFWDYDPILA
jgi:hypothetical protein